MKKRKLRTWVKVVLFIIVLLSLIAICKKQYKNGVDQCVNAGHSQEYCEKGLR